LTTEDNELIKEVFAEASIVSIEESLMTATGPLLLYLPHVPLWLIDWLLYLRRKVESPTVLIVNNFQNIIDTQSKEGEIAFSASDDFLSFNRFITTDRSLPDNNPSRGGLIIMK